MNLAYSLVTLATIIATVASKNTCHACFDGVCYANTPIIDKHRFSGQLAIDRKENIVYFHYKDKEAIDHTAAFDLISVRLKSIPDIDFSFARAVDQTTRDVYIGGANGIYKYNPISNTTTPIGLFDKTIWHMQYKSKIYYTIFNTKGLFTFENKQSKAIISLSNYTIDDFIIDNRDDIFFMSDRKVYRLKKGENSATLFANEIYSLSTDRDGVAHFFDSSKRGLYKLDKSGLIEVGAFSSGFPLKSVFDDDNNVIYHESHSNKLIYLMPTYGRCTITHRMRGSKKNEKKNFKKITGNADTSMVLEVHRLRDKK